mgnify:CR=1 FL=1
MLYPALYDALSKTSPVAAQSVPEAKQEVVAFEHQQAVAKTDFKTGFKEVKQEFPLGETPILVTKCQLRPNPDGNTVLALAPEQGQGIDVNLSNDLLHSFTKLLVDACKIAEWPLDAKTLAQTHFDSGENITLN